MLPMGLYSLVSPAKTPLATVHSPESEGYMTPVWVVLVNRPPPLNDIKGE